MKTICDVYKSIKQPDLYLYVSRKDGLDRVPPELLDKFGEATLALTFVLNEGRKLAREDSQKVSENLINQGYHLQIPPASKIFREAVTSQQDDGI